MSGNADSAPLLDVRGLTVGIRTEQGVFNAIDDVSFTLREGQALGLVGESGCGKTTVGRTILRLNDPVTAGSAHFHGDDVFALQGGDLRDLRRRMQIIFQDPYSSLNPRMTVE